MSVTAVPAARADDYNDLLDLLRAKGSLTQSEYSMLHSRHVKHVREAERADDAARRGHSVRYQYVPRAPDTVDMEAEASAVRAEVAARSAEASMRSAEAEMRSASIVRVAKYVPGKGLTFHAGAIDINLSGFVNGFYSYNSPGRGAAVAGGISSGSSGFDNSGVRNGLLPAALITKISTTQEGVDMQVVFGMYPGLNNNKPGAFNANTGGSSVGLGTPGIDFRQVYFTAGNEKYGTFKIGRDIALFGSDAILNDMTLLGVGSPGTVTDPGNTSFGRIGFGYVYADWIPQISYTSPKFAGLQGSVGIFQPLDQYNYAGGGLSATSTNHNSPMVQAKATYDFKAGDFKGHIWTGLFIQNSGPLSSARLGENSKTSRMAEAGEVGAKLDWRDFQAVAYYYYGSGLGTTGLLFDGIADNGRKRNSEGYYLQLSYTIMKKLRLAGSYGQSNLYQAPGENTPSLVRRNESEVGALYYSVNDWLTLATEFAHSESAAHRPGRATDNTVSAGAMIFF
ncbi:porin [Acetobacter sp. AN02]|nr:porin [Acetobacter sp. AN02]